MKEYIISLLTASLLFCGCSSETAGERLDTASLQPKTNIPPGTLALARLRADIREIADERLDVVNLQPYTNIPLGTLVLVQLRADITDFTITEGSGQPRRYDKPFPSEYIFCGIWPGHVGLRMTNSTSTIFFPGRDIQSIKPVRPNTALEPTPTAP